MNAEIVSRVNKILMKDFELEEGRLSPQATLFDQLGLDSLDIVDLAVALEKEFRLKVKRIEDEEKIRAFQTVRDVYGFVEGKVKEGEEPR